jgi:ribosome-associated protein
LKPLTGRAYLKVAPLGAERSERKGPLATPVLSRAGARRAAETISKVLPDAEEILRLVLARLDDMKAEDTVTIDLTGKSTIADCMVVTSGRSNRHVGAVADRVLQDLAAAGVPDARVEGMRHCDWVLIDAGDVIVHVFRPEVRAFYNLEKMWAPAAHGRRAS